EPMTITRTKAGYHETELTDEAIASATAIRKLLLEQKGDLQRIKSFVPDYTAEIIQRELEAGRAPVTWESFARVVLHQLFTAAPSQLAQIYEVNEGLEHRLVQAVSAVDSHYIPSVEQLLDYLKTKRYTRTKLQRTLTRILLHHTKADITRDSL